MHRRTLFGISAALAGTGTGLLPLASARAQTPWPSQPVRLIVPFAAGGPTDVPARFFADDMGRSLPQRIVVENRTGAGVVVGTELVAKAPKDGNTLLYTTVAHAVLHALFPKLNFDPNKDFTPVALVGVIPMVITVNKDFPAKNLADLVKILKAKPSHYDYASSGNGGALHLASELFLRATDTKANHVPYRGVSAAMPDVLNGSVPIIIDVATTAVPYAQKGETRALAVMSSKRLPQLPDVPTTAEAGYPGLEAYTWHMVLAPAGTPDAVVKAANAAFNKAAASPEAQKKLSDLAMQLVSDSTPESTADFLRSETKKWSDIVEEAHITVN